MTAAVVRLFLQTRGTAGKLEAQWRGKIGSIFAVPGTLTDKLKLICNVHWPPHHRLRITRLRKCVTASIRVVPLPGTRRETLPRPLPAKVPYDGPKFRCAGSSLQPKFPQPDRAKRGTCVAAKCAIASWSMVSEDSRGLHGFMRGSPIESLFSLLVQPRLPSIPTWADWVENDDIQTSRSLSNRSNITDVETRFLRNRRGSMPPPEHGQRTGVRLLTTATSCANGQRWRLDMARKALISRCTPASTSN